MGPVIGARIIFQGSPPCGGLCWQQFSLKSIMRPDNSVSTGHFSAAIPAMHETGFINAEELESIGFKSVGDRVSIDHNALFYGAERISIGSDVRIDACAILSAGEGGIHIGNHVHIAAHALILGAARIELHDFSNISGRVSIYSSSDDFSGAALTNPTVPDEYRNVTSAPVIIGRHVVVGAGSVVLPGVTLAEGSCTGALTLVKHDVPAFSMAVGTAQRIISPRRRDFLDLEKQLLKGDTGNR